ncbi:MAG: hypothetical protein AAGI37_12925 [Planctomycetota bacterium]
MKCFFYALCSLLTAAPAFGQDAILLGSELEPVPVQLQALSPDSIEVIDADGNKQVLQPEQALRLTLTGSTIAAPSQNQVRVVLRDGQAVVGYWGGAGADDESIFVGFGGTDQNIDLPLDEIMSITFRPGVPAPTTEEDDVLLLATGEKLVGFLEWIGAEALEFIVGDADDPIQIPLERVHAVSIANKPKMAEASRGMVRVTTVDGSVILLRSAELERGVDGDALVGLWAMPIAGKPTDNQDDAPRAASRLTLPIKQAAVIEPVSGKRRLVSLADQDGQVVAGGEVFGVAMTPRVETDGALRLHAPVTLGYALPERASRLVFSVAMDVDDTISESRRAMAGCELIVYDGDRVLAKHALTPDGPAKRINVPLRSEELRIELAPGVNGPVLDRVLITRAEVLVSD